MSKLYFIIPFSCILFNIGCRTVQPGSGSLERKAEPYDQFSLQRSFPDRDFDWRGWRNTLQRARTTPVSDRSNSGCGDSSTVAWTQQGPGNVAGRLNTLAIHPDDELTILAGFAGGGLFKTTDAGANWTAVFDEQPELAIGDIVYDPVDPDVVYAGTGDVNIPSIVYNGNGVYKSVDGGNTWQHLGLSQEGIISKIAVDPLNPNILYVAAMGNPYVRDNHRGVYKSTDGGLTWQQVLFVSNQAGAIDLLLNPQNPQVLYATFWDRIRNNQESIIYGPHARVYKSTDGGANWTQLGGGLPTGVMGRTGLAMSAQNPDKVFVLYVDSLSRPGGLYQSLNGGTSWTPINIGGLQNAFADFGWYFGKFRVNPYNDDDWYVPGILLWRKAPGTSSWMIGAGAHADCHDLVFAPSGKRYLATDGGMYANTPGFITWTKSKNLPTTAFYHTNYNPHQPNTYWAGAQDNGVQKGNGTGYNNWVSVFSADGFHVAFDPNNPEQYWVEIQNGTINRTTTDGDSWVSGTTCLGTTDRCNWDTPFFISIHGDHTLYAGTYRAYASPDGSGWGAISQDLTDGNIYGDRFHNVSCMSESPLQAGKLFAGTSDGNVWWRSAAGTWTNITSGLPNRYVTSVQGSPSQVNRIFTTHSGFRDNEEIPHVHRSDNNGQSWTDISSNLPQLPVNDILIPPGYADSLLVVATDAGVYFSRNSGQNWLRLGNNMPFVPVFDLEINVVRDEVMAATFGRGLWTIPIDSLFVTTAAGNITVTVSGEIQTETGTAVNEVIINAGPSSNASGIFELPGVPGCDSILVTPFRNDNPINGVTTYDLVLISKHILAIDTLDTPFKLIAADANKSGTITTFDIVTLRKLILGIDNAFSSNTSWRFVPSDFQFAHLENPFEDNFPENKMANTGNTALTGIDFTGIKIGDLNNSVSPFGAPESRENSPVWPVYFETRQENDQWVADFYTTGAQLSGLQFTLTFNPALLQNVSLEPGDNFGPENFNDLLLQRGILPVCVELPEKNSAETGLRLFRLRFNSSAETSGAAVFGIADSPTPSIAYNREGRPHRLVVANAPANDASPLWYPNPFGAAGVWVVLPDMATNLRLYDARGSLVAERHISPNDNGRLQHFDAALFPSEGIYYYRCRGAEKQTEGSLMFIKN